MKTYTCAVCGKTILPNEKYIVIRQQDAETSSCDESNCAQQNQSKTEKDIIVVDDECYRSVIVPMKCRHRYLQNKTKNLIR